MKNRSAVAVLFLSVFLAGSVLILVALNGSSPTVDSNPDTTRYTYAVVQTYPHDTDAFTQGLIYADGFLIEGTGLYGHSSLRRVELSTGNIIQQVELPYEYYGEGITAVNGTIIQLTWSTNIGFIYDKTNFALLGNFTYPTQGWGLTFDGEQLILSDGSDTLYFLDPATFQRTGQIKVYDGNASVNYINELEYVNGDVYANIWKQQKIAVIDLETGQVEAWVDLTGLEDSTSLGSEEVLNGIAYDAPNDRFFVTGKNWPHVFEIKLVPVT